MFESSQSALYTHKIIKTQSRRSLNLQAFEETIAKKDQNRTPDHRENIHCSISRMLKFDQISKRKIEDTENCYKKVKPKYNRANKLKYLVLKDSELEREIFFPLYSDQKLLLTERTFIIEEDNDLEKTQENIVIVGNEFILIIDDFYKKKYKKN